MSIRFRAIAAIGLASVSVAGCGVFHRSGSQDSAPAPLVAAPTSAVTASALPPPPATPAPAAIPTDVAAIDPAAGPLATPPAAPPSSDVALTRPDVLGSWNIAAAGDSCQLTMVLTTWTGGYRASTRGCNTPVLQGISAWNLEGNQVQLMNDTGATVARLYPASRTQFNGQSEGGGPVTVSR